MNAVDQKDTYLAAQPLKNFFLFLITHNYIRNFLKYKGQVFFAYNIKSLIIDFEKSPSLFTKLGVKSLLA